MTDETTKQKILLTAGPIFAKHGYQGATVREISEAASVNLASINYYFGDKLNLYVEAVKLARIQQSGKAPFAAFDGQMPPEDLLFRFVNVLLRKLGVGESPDWQIQLLITEFLAPGEACRTIVEEHFRPYFSVLLKIVDRIVGRELPRETRLKAGFSIIGQCLHYRLAGPIINLFTEPDSTGQEFQVETIARHITDFSVGGLRALSQV